MSKQFCKHGHNTLATGRYKNGDCKICHDALVTRRYESKKEEILGKQKEYNNGRTGFIKEYHKQYRLEHKEEIQKSRKEWMEYNKEKITDYKKLYRQSHKDEINKKQKERLAKDTNFKLGAYLRSRLHEVIKNNRRVGSFVRDLGCSVDFLKLYIENKFYDGMTWNNWGSVWELDHIKELHTFDLTDRKQFLEAVHHTNLQPLTLADHKKKTARNR